MIDDTELPEPEPERSEMNDALRLGLRRAGLHLIRAGYEVVAGVGALLDELVRARRAQETGASDLTDPQRIELE